MSTKTTKAVDAEIWPFPPLVSTKKKAEKMPELPKKAETNKKHVVMATLNNVELVKAKSALSLDLYANSKKIGNLEVGQGSLFWTGARKRKSKPIDWSTFASMMNKAAYGE